MTFALVLLLLGGFLLGGAWSIWKADSDTAGRTGPQVFFAVALLRRRGDGERGGHPAPGVSDEERFLAHRHRRPDRARRCWSVRRRSGWATGG